MMSDLGFIVELCNYDPEVPIVPTDEMKSVSISMDSLIFLFSETADLIVNVIEGKELVGLDPDPSAPFDSYVRVYLLPDKTTNMQTRVSLYTEDHVEPTLGKE